MSTQILTTVFSIFAKKAFEFIADQLEAERNRQHLIETQQPQGSGGAIILQTDAQTGVCYGTLGNNLPPPSEVMDLCNQSNIKRIRIFYPNPSILQALNSNPGIQVIVGVPNEEITGMAQSPARARTWVQDNILRYPNANFRYVSVGNEISPADRVTSGIWPYVGPAMENVLNALSESGLGSRIKVSTTLSMAVLQQSYPPSSGVFRADFSAFINPIVRLLLQTQSPFLVSIYPYHAYSTNPRDISLDYALFTSPSTVVTDGSHKYQNLFDAMLDSVHAALGKVGAGNLDVVVTATGWPSEGGFAASEENARIYNNSLISHVKNGTPRKPGKPVEAYIFNLIDENQKSPEIEKHWGVFNLANKQPKYPIRF